MKNKSNTGQIILHIMFVIISLCFIIPFIYMISISLSDEQSLILHGYSLIPKKFSLEAYNLVFKNSKQILMSYQATTIYSIISTILAIVVMSMFAYPLSRSTYKHKNALSLYVLITMLFNAGMVPNYLLITKYLHLDNTIWVYIFPGLVSAWNLIIIRTNFNNIPVSLIESAKLDGASEGYICFKIVIPLSLPTLAAIAFLFLVPKWNDWYTTLLYVREPSLYSLQYVLQRILREADFAKQMVELGQEYVDTSQIPTESFKYAIALIVAGPMLIIFPFFQKFFVKGMTVGAIKG